MQVPIIAYIIKTRKCLFNTNFVQIDKVTENMTKVISEI